MKGIIQLAPEKVIYGRFHFTSPKLAINCLFEAAEQCFWSISADCGLCHGQYLLTLIISCCYGQSASANIFSAAQLQRPPSQPRAFYLLIMILCAIPSFSHFYICCEIALIFSEDGCLLGGVNE